MKKVSVIIPVFNTEKYIEECLESVLNQSLKDIEIICVNDGSVDRSLEILRGYERQYDQIKVIDQLNVGQSAARNRALQVAEGEYIYFMDSDDLITSHMLEELWTICKDKNLDLLYFSGTSFYENDELSEKHSGFLNAYYRKGIYTEVMEGPRMLSTLRDNRDYFVSPCLQIINRKFLMESGIRFIEGIIHEDNCFSFQILLKASRVFCVNDIYFYRRVRNSSVMTQEENIRNLRGYFCCLVEQMNFVREFDFDDPEINKKIDLTLWLLNHQVQRVYQKITPKEQQEFIRQCTPYERVLFNALILDTIRVNVASQKQIKKLNGQIKKIKKSHSYKIGRRLTAPYRLIKGGIKCMKQHGVIYTCKLTLKKIKKKMIG